MLIIRRATRSVKAKTRYAAVVTPGQFSSTGKLGLSPITHDLEAGTIGDQQRRRVIPVAARRSGVHIAVQALEGRQHLAKLWRGDSTAITIAIASSSSAIDR